MNKSKGSFSFLLILLSLGLLLSQCSGPAEYDPPEIMLLNPQEGSSYSVSDTIFMDLEITASAEIVFTKIDLINDKDIAVISNSVSVGGTALSLYNYPLVISRQDLPTGNYRLHIRVENEFQSSNLYRSVLIQEKLLATEGVYLISHNWNNVTNFELMDSLMIPTPVYSLSGDYGGAVVNSDRGYICSIGEYTGNFVCYHPESNTVMWQYQALINPPFPYFTSICRSSMVVYVSLYRDFIFGYDDYGVEKIRTWLTNDKYPYRSMLTENFLLTAEKGRYLDRNYITSYYLASGVTKDAFETEYEELFFLLSNDDNVYVAGAKPWGGVDIILYDVENNHKEPIMEIEGKIVCVEKCGLNRCLIATKTEVLLYSAPYQIRSVIQKEDVSSITYNYADGTIWLISGQEVLKYRDYSYVLEKSNTFEATLDDLVIMYNRDLFLTDY